MTVPRHFKAAEFRRLIEDVEFLVTNCDAHLESEFRQFLVQIGCTNATITSVGY